MNNYLAEILVGRPFLNELPESAKRSYKIISNSSVPIQNLEEISQYIWKHVNEVNRVSIFTGFYCKSGYETDGPVGALILAELFIKAKIPVQICCEKDLLNIMKSIASELSLHEMISFTPIEELNNTKNSMFFTIERPGENCKGICHSMDGQKITHPILALESEIQKNPPNAWIAIGDGGNELGTGYYRETIENVIQYGKNCNCGCKGGIAAKKLANRCILSTTSNFGAISLSLELAKQKKIEWNVPADKVMQIISILNKHGIKDGVTGEDGTVDGISAELRKKMYDLLKLLF
ncbi:MAG: glutamate cyclase domain-containing protein [Promethearchaeota archaeon]